MAHPRSASFTVLLLRWGACSDRKVASKKICELSRIDGVGMLRRGWEHNDYQRALAYRERQRSIPPHCSPFGRSVKKPGQLSNDAPRGATTAPPVRAIPFAFRSVSASLQQSWLKAMAAAVVSCALHLRRWTALMLRSSGALSMET